MAEFAFNIAEKVLEKLASLAYQEVCLAWGLESDLEKLQLTFSTIKAVLLDAEEKQAKDHQLRVWLEELKDAFYDAEDVLDEFECDALRRDVVRLGSNCRKVRCFFSSSNPLVFRLWMGHKIKEIRERFDEIASRKANFHLVERLEDRRTMHRERAMTHSFLSASDVIGRDSDKDNIIRLLIDKGDDNNVSVIPIVGIGGMGKTTLAKMVYNDESVTRHFQLKMWVCVSDHFDVKNLIEEIVSCATLQYCGDLTFDLLQTRLRQTLSEKKFLLVLDDVWNEDPGKWNQLNVLLTEGSNGSKILVTTRTDLVASLMGTVRPYPLQGLPHEDCMSLFKKWAFKEGQAERYPVLIEMGNDIVKKCKGVPLAVRTLGSLLYLKTDERDWLFVKDNDIWELEQREGDILPALKLSYDQMPSHLKQCFAYCSMFPKDHEFNSLYLIQFWMAHGLITDKELEHVGMQYIKELCSRCFFHDVDDRGFYFSFKMHDLVHDLALLVMQGELSIVNSQTQNVSQKVRHLSLSTNSWFGEVQTTNVSQSLRTIFFPTHLVGSSSESVVDTCIRRFKYLRMLDLSNSSFEVLSSSIDDLKHLRYLDLSRNANIKNLPGSICSLQNLQTLRLVNCWGLEKLPNSTQDMISLRFLEITIQQKQQPENVIGCLNSLRFLSFCDCHDLASLKGMQHLTALQTLHISGCSNLNSLPNGMRYLTALQNLVIINCGRLSLELEGENNRGFKIRTLWIEELPRLVALPRWLLEGSTSSLQFMHIENCVRLTVLPEWLQNLTSLEKLEIEDCSKLSSLPEGTRHLSALKELKIKNCDRLSRRCERERGEDWPKIAHVAEIEITN